MLLFAKQLRKHYWHLRAARGFDLARIRREYRRIAAEKNACSGGGGSVICRACKNARRALVIARTI